MSSELPKQYQGLQERHKKIVAEKVPRFLLGFVLDNLTSGRSNRPKNQIIGSTAASGESNSKANTRQSVSSSLHMNIE